MANVFLSLLAGTLLDLLLAEADLAPFLPSVSSSARPKNTKKVNFVFPNIGPRLILSWLDNSHQCRR